jgi:uncharacterized protein YbjT (DUF2867 family)
VIDELLAGGHRVRALTRARPVARDGVDPVRGDLFDDAALDAGMQGCAAVIHLVGIIREDPVPARRSSACTMRARAAWSLRRSATT